MLHEAAVCILKADASNYDITITTGEISATAQ
jgi:hypothetical protein